MPAQPLSVKKIFLAALAVPAADRADWPRQECGQDAELRITYAGVNGRE